jgi:Winged helix DNA-binding domain
VTTPHNERVLSLRQLNRTTLSRQVLLDRAALPVADCLERLVGMQAQLARSPYVGLWTRLENFNREDLGNPIDERHIVKATFLRGTLHLLTRSDFLKFRPTLQPVLTNALEAVLKERGAEVDVPRLVDAARELMRTQPRSFAEITTLVTGLIPDGDPGAMRYAVRTHLPMIQVPIQRIWSYPGNPRFTLADAWLGTALPTAEHLPDLVKRYLAAFGPATVSDMQTWSYLPNLQPVFETLRPEMVSYRDERRRELFDLPQLPIEVEDVPAPVRFLPEFDNLLLAHQDRTRVMPKAFRSKVYLPGLRVAATVLIDGFVAGTWTTERVKRDASATVVIEPFGAVTGAIRDALLREGEQLARFVEPDARTFAVRIGDYT